MARFEAEGVKPFQYEQRSRGKTVTVASYWQMPDRLYDDPEELAQWARLALGAAERSAAAKQARTKPRRRAALKSKPAKAAPAKPKRAAKAKAAKAKQAKSEPAKRAKRSARTVRR